MNLYQSPSSLLLMLFLAGCGVGERDMVIESCEQSIVTSDCKWKGQLFSCILENNGDTTFVGTPIWKYDQEGNLLEKSPYTYAAGLKVKDKVRVKLPVTKYNKDVTVKIIFCRNDPKSSS